MIVFDLKCSSGHVFEAWFGSSTAYAEQNERGLVACPLCGATGVTKAVMAPNVAAKGNSKPSALPQKSVPEGRLPAPTPQQLMPEMMKVALHAIATAQAEALKSSEWVGTAFADRARAMHSGEEDAAPIHGQSTAAEVRDLVEDGVPIAPLLVPLIPPDALN